MRDPREIVRAGYDRVSHAYRGDHFELEGSNYGRWLAHLVPDLPAGARVLDLGCGCGVPVAAALARQFRVTGVDFSLVQIERARLLVPGAEFVCADMVVYPIEPGSWHAIVSLFAIIHLPLDEQPGLIRRMAAGLRPDGRILATVGHEAWTGTEEDWCGVDGATMSWSHADVATYRRWFAEAGLEILEEWFKPEGSGGHSALMARACRAG